RRVGWVAAVGLAVVCAAGAGALFAAPASWRPAGIGAILGFTSAASLRLVAAGLAQGYADFSGQAVASLGAVLVLPAGAIWLFVRGGDADTALWITTAHAALTGALTLVRLRGRLGRGGAPLDVTISRRIW